MLINNHLELINKLRISDFFIEFEYLLILKSLIIVLHLVIFTRFKMFNASKRVDFWNFDFLSLLKFLFIIFY